MTTTKPAASPLVLRFVDKINLVSLLSGTFSFCSSLLVATMIHKAGSGLSTSYRRIIFCLSVSDVIQSIAVMLGPFLLPKSTTATTAAAGDEEEDSSSTRSSWAFGNVHTCDFQGFILTFGATTTCMYTLFLCLYYYCKLKRGMSDDAFKDKIEKKMHCFIPSFNLLVCSIALGTKTFNPLPEGAGSCQIMRKPDGCDPNIPDSCERGLFAFQFGLFYFPVGVPCLCILGTIVFMFSIVVHVVKRDHRFRQDRTSGGSKLDDNTNSNTTTTGSRTAVKRQDQTEADRVARLLRREVTLQVILYVSAFLLAYGWIVVLSFQSRANNITPSVFVAVMVALFFPSTGILNILIYTRPQIVAYRRLHRDTSWPVAFWRVLRAGGENPDSSLSSPISSPRSARCCQGDCFSSVCRKYDNERNSERNVTSGILRVMGMYMNRSSIPSDPALKNQKKRRRGMKKKADSLGTNSIEKPISMGSNILEHDTEEGWKEDVGIRSTNLENNEFQSIDVVRHISLLASQKSAISKAFEKASERAKTLNVEGVVLEKKDVGIASDSERSSNRIYSEWSCGVSPGSLIDHSFNDLSLESDIISGEWTNIE